MRVLLTGATGFLGGRLCSALVHSGHTVRVTVRAKSVTSELPPEVEIANCDIQDAPALLKACEGCDAVIHTAALVGSWLPDSSQFITVNVQGLRNVIDAVKANPSVKKLVYTSSFFALGYTDGHIADEDQVHPGKFMSPYEESKFLADNVAQEAAAEGVPIVSVYPGVVYGPGKLTAGNSLALMLIGRFKGQSPGYIGNGADKFSFSHVDDVASGHLAAMEIGKGGGRYLLCGDNASYVEIYDLAASLTHTKPPSFHIPFWALELAGHISVMWAYFSFCTGISKSVPTLTSNAVQILKHQWAYSSAKAERELGYKSRPLKEGLSELLAWLKATGRITY
ncbi:unnamed protein product [Sphagnum compactum]